VENRDGGCIGPHLCTKVGQPPADVNLGHQGGRTPYSKTLIRSLGTDGTFTGFLRIRTWGTFRLSPNFCEHKKTA